MNLGVVSKNFLFFWDWSHCSYTLRQWLLANVLLSLNANLGAFAVYGHRRHTTQTVVGAGVAPRRFFWNVAWQNDFEPFFRQARKEIRSRSTLYVRYFLTAHDGERAGIGQTCPHERRRDDINVVLRVPIWGTSALARAASLGSSGLGRRASL